MTHLSVPQMILESHFLLGLPWPRWSLPYPISHPQPWPWAITFLFSVFFFFLATMQGLWDLSSGLRAVERRSANHWAAREFPPFFRLIVFFFQDMSPVRAEFLCLAATRPAQPKNKYINLKYTNSNLDKMGRDRNVFQMKESDKM